jgi:hypothetical protein
MAEPEQQLAEISSSKESHQSAAAQLERNYKLRSVFGLERPDEDKQKRVLDAPKTQPPAPKTYALVKTPSPGREPGPEGEKADETSKKDESDASPDKKRKKKKSKDKKKKKDRKKRDK